MHRLAAYIVDKVEYNHAAAMLRALAGSPRNAASLKWATCKCGAISFRRGIQYMQYSYVRIVYIRPCRSD